MEPPHAGRRQLGDLIIPDFDRLLLGVEAMNPHQGSWFHGPNHWRCVAAAGLELLRETPGSDPAVVFLFALFHDSQRWDDGVDPDHGPRGAALAARLHGDLFRLPSGQLDILMDACSRHTGAPPTPDPTLGVCWDADRLNLYRVGTTPRVEYLSTEAARRRIAWAADLHEKHFTWQHLFEAYSVTWERRT